MKKFDAIVIGMGPAGMAITAMGSAMGLKILSVEGNKIGGECLNIGCIPSKGILKASENIYNARNLDKYGFSSEFKLNGGDPLEIVRNNVKAINNKKFLKTFEKATLIQGFASFIDKKTISVNNEKYTAKNIFIATGTHPFIPPIPGLKDIEYLTNENIFELKHTPKSMTIIGGGAIGSEMAQAFSRLGSKVTIIQMDSHLIPNGDKDAAEILEDAFKKEDIDVYNNTAISKIEKDNNEIIVHTDKGIFNSEKILVAAGREATLTGMNLAEIGIKLGKNKILVDSRLRTNIKNIYAVGDINGIAQLSHAAMHQGMLALMDAISPISIKRLKYKNYTLPWSVFTSPESSQVGLTEKEAKAKGLKYEITKKDYSSYGLTVSVGKPDGFIKVIHSPMGKIYGVTIIGENSSELINEWALAIQNKIKLHQVMMTMHSFPSFSMLNKMVTEDWMMKKMNNNLLKKFIKWLY